MLSFPKIQQLSQMECGPTALRIVAKYYGKHISSYKAQELCFLSREGSSLLNLSDAAENIGFRTRAVKLNLEKLHDDVPLPCIAHWGDNHFVVVYKIRKNTIYVSDPAFGLIRYSKKEFKEKWYKSFGNEKLGVALILEPTPAFYKTDPEEGKKLSLKYLLRYLRPYYKYLFQIFLGMLTGSAIALILPFMTQAVVDYGINNSDLNFIVMVLIGQALLTLSQTSISLIRSWLFLHVSTRVSIALISDFLSKLMKLPVSFFDSKMIGDIMQRIGDHGRIQSFMTGSLMSILFSFISLIVYSIIMAVYHSGILMIFYAGSILYATWVFLFLKKRRELDFKRFDQSSANQSNIVQLITGMQEIKMNACERQKRWEWETIQARLFKIAVKGLVIGQSQQVGGFFINQTKNIFITFLSAKAVVDGEMTLGMMMAVQYIIGQLNAPIQQFIGFVQTAQDAKISLERLGEVHERENEEEVEDNRIKKIPKHNDLLLKDVTFQYNGPHSEKVLNRVSIKIPPNKTTAIVGSSGSGKSTLIKLLLGFYQPVEGDVFLNSRTLKRYSPREWRKRCGIVMQEGFIFSDTIANNIGIIDETPDYEKIEKAVTVANIKDFIEDLPLGYETKIGSEGHGLSTGQKQRLLIARAVYKDPDYIFFDEATNALDAKNEKIIMKNLEGFFKERTVVVVAHRLSTVRKADQIIVLDKGGVAEQGTHKELIAQEGIYFNLIKDQLELGN
jgi:ATP-binding cassette subfamily B protein